MGFMEAVRSGFSKYVTFSGRARRSEFWFWVLFVVILSIIAAALDGVLNPDLVTTTAANGSYGVSVVNGPISIVVSLALLLPGLAMSIRRLHDTDHSGWWLLIALIPLIGAIVLLVFYCTEGTRGGNRFGDDPKLR